MKLGRGTTRIIVIGGLLLLITLSGLGALAFRNNMAALQKSTQENILWSATQLEFELARFIAALGAFGSGADGVGPDVVNNRFDVLWSRVTLFDKGDTGRRLSRYDAEKQRVKRLFASMQELEPRIVNLQPGDRDTANDLIAVFSAHADALRGLSTDVLIGEEHEREIIRNDVNSSAHLTLILAVSAIVIAAGGMVLLASQNRRLRQMAEDKRQLAVAAERAARTKSRFLSMMSHELRTPMNGLLGLLALAKQPGLPLPQLRLVEQAERSGREMIEILSDVLDFSALHDDELELESKPFAPSELARAVRDLFDPVARREGIKLQVTAEPDLPDEVVGDMGRLRQALSHLAAYVVGTAATRALELNIAHDGTDLLARLSFDYGANGAVWRPELILGAPERGEDQFASDALGPAISRLMIEKMGGDIRLGAETDGRISVVVRVPARPVTTPRPCIRLELQTAALEMICRAALQKVDPVYHTDDMTSRVNAVILQGGGDDERDRVAELRERFPGSRLFALGDPRDPGLFDAVISLPMDSEQLMGIVGELRLAS
ncbi:MAG: hypothetical protein D6754_11485 [Alphaproteobacteria bacterium]|nr:MAG: hypothetical protein D6754_11485 [Alphaproteobacteria bacterium]